VSYASKTFTEAEYVYAHVEREKAAIILQNIITVFGAESLNMKQITVQLQPFLVQEWGYDH
jgi:hypothetical protein